MCKWKFRLLFVVTLPSFTPKPLLLFGLEHSFLLVPEYQVLLTDWNAWVSNNWRVRPVFVSPYETSPPIYGICWRGERTDLQRLFPPACNFLLAVSVPLPSSSLHQNWMSGYSLRLFCQNDLSDFKYFLVGDYKQRKNNPCIKFDRTGLEEAMHTVAPHRDGGLREQLGGAWMGHDWLWVCHRQRRDREVCLTGLSLNLASSLVHFSVKKKVWGDSSICEIAASKLLKEQTFPRKAGIF